MNHLSIIHLQPDLSTGASVANDYKKNLVESQLIIEDQQRFEQLVSGIAIKINQTKTELLEATIDKMLQSIGQFFHAKRSFLGQFSQNYNQLHFTNIWVAKDMHPVASATEIKPSAKKRTLCQQVRDDELIHSDTKLIERSNEKSFRQMLESHGIPDGMVAPICVKGKLIGLLGLDSFTRPCKYPLANADRLQIIANMVGSMIIRIQKTNPYCE